jgi:Trypsin-like peptidase domain/zinc-ribbon domain
VRHTSTRRVRQLLLFMLASALAAGLALAATPPPAWAQTAAADTRSVTLASPAVSFVETDLRVCVRVQLSDLSRCYRQGWTGSAFAINANGSLVTASHVVHPDANDRRALRNWAVNQLFGVPLRSDQDPAGRHQPFSDPQANRALMACYTGDVCDFTLKASVHVYPAVQVAGLSVPKPLSATVVRSSDFEQADIAVLQVDATNLPTVQLEASTNDLAPGDPLVALGYPGSTRDLPTGMTEPTKTFGRVSNIRTGAVGASKQIEVDLSLKHGLSGGPVVNAAGKVVGLISYSLLGDDGAAEQGYIRSVEDIRATLKAAGVEAARGDGDTVFAQAMQYFWDRHYSAALPLFQRVLNLYDGHPLAKQYLAKAQAKANGSEDVPLPSDGPPVPRGDLMRVWLPVAGVLVVLVVLLVVVLRRRGPSRLATVPARPTVPAPVPVPNPDSDRQPFGWQLQDDFAPSPAAVEPTPDRGADGSSDVEPSVGGVVTALDQSELTSFERVTMPQYRFCSHCGHELDPGSRFCSACGQPVR